MPFWTRSAVELPESREEMIELIQRRLSGWELYQQQPVKGVSPKAFADKHTPSHLAAYSDKKLLEFYNWVIATEERLREEGGAGVIIDAYARKLWGKK